MRPLGNKIMLDIEELKFGAIESESIAECGKIVAIGAHLQAQQYYDGFIGATLYFKSWAVDIITDPKDNKKYYFISADSDAICGISND